MSTPTVTERDARLREQAAYRVGVRDAVNFPNNAKAWTGAGLEYRSAKLYPLPRVTRPRVLIDESGMAWKVDGGSFWYSLSGRPDSLDWKRDDPCGVMHELTTTRVHLWADLLARPTGQVEVEE